MFLNTRNPQDLESIFEIATDTFVLKRMYHKEEAYSKPHKFTFASNFKEAVKDSKVMLYYNVTKPMVNGKPVIDVESYLVVVPNSEIEGSGLKSVQAIKVNTNRAKNTALSSILDKMFHNEERKEEETYAFHEMTDRYELVPVKDTEELNLNIHPKAKYYSFKPAEYVGRKIVERTEEQKAEAAERLRKARESKKNEIVEGIIKSEEKSDVNPVDKYFS